MAYLSYADLKNRGVIFPRVSLSFMEQIPGFPSSIRIGRKKAWDEAEIFAFVEKAHADPNSLLRRYHLLPPRQKPPTDAAAGPEPYKAKLAALQKENAKLKAAVDRVRTEKERVEAILMNACRDRPDRPFTKVEFNIVVKALHPDTRKHVSEEVACEAFKIFNGRRLVLLKDVNS
jgi:hypothetical protein